MSSQARHEFDYVAVGHVTADITSEDGSSRPGGGAFYSALQAARLGLRTLIVTRGEPRELAVLLAPYTDEFELEILPSPETTTMLTAGSGAQRSQRVLAWAGPIDERIEIDAAILHLAPVARETPSHWHGCAGFIGLTPQGLVREWDNTGEVRHAPLARASLPARFDALVISQVELASCEWLLPPAAATAAHPIPGEQGGEPQRPLIIVTAGSEPIAIHSPAGTEPHAPALTVEAPRDDLGAGDVFAAAVFVALAEGHSPAEAVAHGSAAAAVRLSGVGPDAVGYRDAVLRRLEETRSV